MQAVPLLQVIKLLCIYVLCNKIGHSNALRVTIDGFCNVSYETPVILNLYLSLNVTSLHDLYCTVLYCTRQSQMKILKVR